MLDRVGHDGSVGPEECLARHGQITVPVRTSLEVDVASQYRAAATALTHGSGAILTTVARVRGVEEKPLPR